MIICIGRVFCLFLVVPSYPAFFERALKYLSFPSFSLCFVHSWMNMYGFVSPDSSSSYSPSSLPSRLDFFFFDRYYNHHHQHHQHRHHHHALLRCCKCPLLDSHGTSSVPTRSELHFVVLGHQPFDMSELQVQVPELPLPFQVALVALPHGLLHYF